MTIRVKLGGELKRYGGGSQAIEIDSPITVTQAMERLGIEEEADEVLVILNDEIVPPAERAGQTLENDDRLTLMPQLKGG